MAQYLSFTLLFLNGQQQLTATVTPQGSSVTWDTTDPAVATVDNNGIVTANGVGLCYIYATISSVPAVYDRCAINVSYPQITSITLSESELEFKQVGETATLTATTTPEIPHLHLVVNRIYKDGNINDCHFIGERAVAAAHAINLRHGWKDPMEIRAEHIQQVTSDCMDMLKSLPRFDWADYEALLTKRGYKVKIQRDKENVVRGYSIKKGNSSYKSSELGTGRNLMPTKIENTWKKLHPAQKPMAVQTPKSLDSRKPIMDRPSMAKAVSSQTQPIATSNDYRQVFLIDGKQVQLSIPERIFKKLDSNIEVPENSNATHGDILKVAMLLFLNYVDAATAMSESFGGGGGTGTGWGKDKDEDELEWSRRCAKMANWLCKPFARRWKRGK